MQEKKIIGKTYEGTEEYVAFLLKAIMFSYRKAVYVG